MLGLPLLLILQLFPPAHILYQFFDSLLFSTESNVVALALCDFISQLSPSTPAPTTPFFLAVSLACRFALCDSSAHRSGGM